MKITKNIPALSASQWMLYGWIKEGARLFWFLDIMFKKPPGESFSPGGFSFYGQKNAFL